MTLTTTQETTLAGHIRASTSQPTINALAAGDMGVLATIYNTPGTHIVWRSSVPENEYRKVMVWSEVDGMTVGKERIFAWMTGNLTLDFEPSDPNVQAGLSDAFPASGQGSTPLTRAALIALSKRAALLVEEVLATGSGAGTNGDPDAMDYIGQVHHSDISAALNGNP